jgi:hypothetical protein
MLTSALWILSCLAKNVGRLASDLLGDELVAVDLPGPEQIMRGAMQATIVDAGLTAAGERLAVLYRQEATLLAAPALRVDEGALVAVALAHRALNGYRNVTRARHNRPLLARFLRADETLLGDLHEVAQRASEDGRQLSAGDSPIFLTGQF